MSALETGVINAIRECEYQGWKSLGLPQIGCGIGGLQWEDVKRVIEEIAKKQMLKFL